MDRDGLLRKVYDSALNIDQGRKWQNTIGLEANGRAAYQLGLADAMESFKDSQSEAANDLNLLLLAEQTFIIQELQLCDPSETQTIASLEQAIRSFDDALRVLEIVDDSHLYAAVEKSYPIDGKYRYKGMPKDSFHIGCLAHRTRIGNILRAPGINLLEKQLLEQRAENMKVAQNIYLDKQKESLKANDCV
jgi:hypothetical protein